MAKKKSSRKKADDQAMIHFRPGEELGSLVGQLADELAISRGETAKRLTALAVRGFDLGFYPQAEELTGYLYGSESFDQACHHLHVAVLEFVGDDKDVVEVAREDKLEAVRVHLERHRLMRSVEEGVENKRVSIKVHQAGW